MDYWRQTRIVDANKLREQPITIIGLGGIGSPTALCLAKMGAGFVTLIDDDKIEPHNLPSTAFRRDQLGMDKVEAAKQLMEEVSDEVRPLAYFGRFPAEQSSIQYGVLISGVDSMRSRQNIWERIRSRDSYPLYIDARMGGQTAELYCIRPNNADDMKFYDTVLPNDDEIPDADCTNRAIIYNTSMIASLICWQVKNFVMGEPVARVQYFDYLSQQWYIPKETT